MSTGAEVAALVQHGSHSIVARFREEQEAMNAAAARALVAAVEAIDRRKRAEDLRSAISSGDKVAALDAALMLHVSGSAD